MKPLTELEWKELYNDGLFCHHQHRWWANVLTGRLRHIQNFDRGAADSRQMERLVIQLIGENHIS